MQTNNPLTEIFSQARKQPGHRVHERSGNDPVYVPRKPTVLRSMNLKTSFMPSMFDKNGQIVSVPAGQPAGEKIPLSASIIAASRVAQAGAHIIFRGEQATPIATGTTGGMVMQREAEWFSTIEAAGFNVVADDSDVAASALPMSRAAIDFSDPPSIACRFEIGHVSQKQYPESNLADELMVSIALGLARAADKMLLDAIVATTPAVFTLGAAAAQGLKARELRAVVGTDGAGTYFGSDGELIVNPFDVNGWKPSGIPAELTADMAGTVIGAFNRAAVSISDDVHVLAERLGADGKLSVTCWASAIPIVPNSAMFWQVAAT